MSTADLLGTVRQVFRTRHIDREVIEHVPEGSGPDDAPPLLFVHGAGHGAWCWEEHWMPEAAHRGWRTYAVSLRGHGKSDGRDERHRWRISHYERDVVETMKELPGEPVLVGHDVGATVVQRILADGSARAGVLVAPIPPRGGFRLPLRILRRHPTDVVRLALLQPLPARPDYYFSSRLDVATAERYAQRLEPESVVAQFETALPRRGHRLAATTEVPVLVLGGEQDALVDPVDIVKTAKIYDTQARLFRDMGHDLMLDAGWRAPLEVMLHWLEEEVV